MRRYCKVVRLRLEHRDEYIAIHNAVWPTVLATIERCHIRNYSIFLHGDLLIAYFEYHGADFDADMARMAADPETQRWWDVTNAMLTPVPDGPAVPGWHDVPQVFHTD
jgi:L-rhamnose mutarotase